jgi:hypothetical protein
VDSDQQKVIGHGAAQEIAYHTVFSGLKHTVQGNLPAQPITAHHNRINNTFVSNNVSG